MNYIITKHPEFFKKIGIYNFCNLDEMILPNEIALDTETTGLMALFEDVFCIQIGTGFNNYIIHMYDDNYIFEDAIPYLKNRTLVLHNALFDLGFMYKHKFYPKNIRDTMLANKILYNGQYRLYDTKKGKIPLPVKNDFGSVMEFELGIKYDKTDQKNIHIVKLSQQSTIQYSFNDVDKLLSLHNVLADKIKKLGYQETYDLHCRYIRALAYMEQCGMPINPVLWKNKMEQDLINTESWKTKIEEYIYDNANKFADRQIDMFDTIKRINVSLQSPKQMIEVFNYFEIPTKDKDGKDSIDSSIISKSKHEFVKMWLAFQNANHRVTTFGDSIYKKIINNRIYTNFNPMVDTARLSTRKGNINFLNFPADKITRYCFEANRGNKMIVCDWSGQETVIVADLSGDAAMTKSVVEGADLHSLLARVLFPELKDMTDEEIMTEHSDKRKASKSPRFAMSYGGNAYTIHMNEGIPMARAIEIENGFKELHAGLYEWGDKVFQASIKTGYIESVDGWRLKLPKFDLFKDLGKKVNAISKEEWRMYRLGKEEALKLKKKEDYKIRLPESYNFYKSKKKMISDYFKLRSEYQRLCLNNPVQTRGSHQLKLAKCLLFEWIEENDYLWKILICNSPHDEIVLESKEDLAEISKLKLEEFMLKGGNYYLSKLKIKADAAIGNSWGEAK